MMHEPPHEETGTALLPLYSVTEGAPLKLGSSLVNVGCVHESLKVDEAAWKVTSGFCPAALAVTVVFTEPPACGVMGVVGSTTS